MAKIKTKIDHFANSAHSYFVPILSSALGLIFVVVVVIVENVLQRRCHANSDS